MKGSTSLAPLYQMVEVLGNARNVTVILILAMVLRIRILEGIWQGYFSCGSILIHVTKMFILQTIYNASA
jgi:hypothetical protein